MNLTQKTLLNLTDLHPFNILEFTSSKNFSVKENVYKQQSTSKRMRKCNTNPLLVSQVLVVGMSCSQNRMLQFSEANGESPAFSLWFLQGRKSSTLKCFAHRRKESTKRHRTGIFLHRVFLKQIKGSSEASWQKN